MTLRRRPGQPHSHPRTVAPHSLQITPASATLLVGDSRQFTVVDERGVPSPIATWSVDNTSLASIDTNAAPTLTALASGTVNLTAKVEGVSTTMPVTISGAASLVPGTVTWTTPPLPGFTPSELVQAEPSIVGINPDLYSISTNAAARQTAIQAFTIDGQQMWQMILPLGSNGLAMPDGFAGTIVGGACDNTNSVPMTVTDVTAQGGIAWQIQITSASQGACPPTAPKLAIQQNGDVVVANGLQVSPAMVVVDGQAGSVKSTIPIPQSTTTDGFGNVTSCDCLTPVGQPIVDSDGSTYVEYEQRQIPFPANGINATLFLMKINTDGTTSTVLLATSTTANLFPGKVLPDGAGNVLATWTDSNVTPPMAPQPYQAAYVSGMTVTATYAMPNAPTSLILGLDNLPINPVLVLGENGTAFVSYGSNMTSFQMASGSVNWNYPAAQGASLSIIAAQTGNGLAAKSTDSNNVDTLIFLDATGTLTNAPWAGSHVQYWAGNTYPGLLSTGVTQYSGQPIPDGDSALDRPGGTNRAAFRLIVGNASNTGPNQTAIAGVFSKIKTALDADAQSTKPTCSNWLQGQGSTGSQVIQSLLDNNTFGHGTFNTQNIAAVHGLKNLDNSPTGIPTNFTITVNDASAFFTDKDVNGGSFLIGPQRYAGNTLRARAMILIHELGHTLPAPGFQEDMGRPKAVEANNKLVDTNCRRLIEGLQ